MNEVIEDFLVESLTKIANTPSVIEKFEHNIIEPQKVEHWMVRRIIYANLLLRDEIIKKVKEE